MTGCGCAEKPQNSKQSRSANKKKVICKCCKAPDQTRVVTLCAPGKKAKYVQPPIPDSFAPKRIFVPPTDVFEDNTVHKLSYRPIQISVRRAPCRPKGSNLGHSNAKFIDATVHKLSYLPIPFSKVPALKPFSHDLQGRGPMQFLTTQKHDYVPKPILSVTKIRPSGNLGISEKPFEDKTVHLLSYRNPGPQPIPKSCRPRLHPLDSDAKMECATIQKLSYRPNPAHRRWIPPWQKRLVNPKWYPPTVPFVAETIYRNSYATPGWHVREEEGECTCDNYNDAEDHTNEGVCDICNQCDS